MFPERLPKRPPRGPEEAPKRPPRNPKRLENSLHQEAPEQHAKRPQIPAQWQYEPKDPEASKRPPEHRPRPRVYTLNDAPTAVSGDIDSELEPSLETPLSATGASRKRPTRYSQSGHFEAV